MALTITDDNFNELVLQSSSPVLVDFWADWCNGCQMLNPVIEALFNDYKGKAVVAKVNVDANPGIAKKYNIHHIPALLFFKDGQIVDQYTGAAPGSFLKEKLNKQCC